VTRNLDATYSLPSIQDCLTAYLVTVLNRCLDTPISEITNAASYRQLSGPFVNKDVAGNAIYIISTHLRDGPSESSLCDVALAIRNTLERCRMPEFIEQYMSVASHLMLAAANEDRSLFFSTPPGRLSVNSNTVLAWRSAHFGFPDGARFFTAGVNERYVRVFRSNPIRKPGREERPEWVSRDEDVDVTFGIASYLRPSVMAILSSELNGHLEFRANVDGAVRKSVNGEDDR